MAGNSTNGPLLSQSPNRPEIIILYRFMVKVAHTVYEG